MTAHTRVSAKGQVVIPKSVRDELGWPAGTDLQVEKVGGAVTLRPVGNKRGSLTLEAFVARRPKYVGAPKSLDQIDAAVARAMSAKFAKEYKTRG